MIPDPARAAAVDVPALHAWLRERQGEMIDDLAEYVNHETPSTDKALLDAGLTWLERWLFARLGAPARRRRMNGGRYGDTLVLDYPGSGSEPLLFLAHYDTVWEAGTLTAWPFTVVGGRATGPGVVDMKAGLVQAVWGLLALDALGLPHPPVRLLLNGDEEIGSPASRPFIEEAAADAELTLVFEASADGALKTSRKGVGMYRLHARGVEAHAGVEPAQGASAIDALAALVGELRALTHLGAGTTVNVGTFHGGTRCNVVAGYAYCDIDVRAATQAEAERVGKALDGLTSPDPRVTLTLEGGWNRPAMERTGTTARLVALAQALAGQLGVSLGEAAVGGASDGNFVAALGRPVLDGLGAIGSGAHARHEHVLVDAMPERAALAAGLCAVYATA